MALAKVLQTFPYAHDGAHVRLLEPGEVVDIRLDVLPGLIETGQVDAMTIPSATAAAKIADAKAAEEAAARRSRR